SQVSFINCVFDHNSGTVVVDQTGPSTSNFDNCIFAGNQLNNTYVIHNQDASMSLVNCSLVNNTGVGFVGGGSGVATIKNCIFWNNSSNSTTEGTDIQPGAQTLVIANTITQSYYQDGNNTLLVNYNPRFFNIANPA